MIPFSLLDLAPTAADSDAGTALRNSVDLARHPEDLGYRRYWVAGPRPTGCGAPPDSYAWLLVAIRWKRPAKLIAGAVVIATPASFRMRPPLSHRAFWWSCPGRRQCLPPECPEPLYSLAICHSP